MHNLGSGGGLGPGRYHLVSSILNKSIYSCFKRSNSFRQSRFNLKLLNSRFVIFHCFLPHSFMCKQFYSFRHYHGFGLHKLVFLNLVFCFFLWFGDQSSFLQDSYRWWSEYVFSCNSFIVLVIVLDVPLSSTVQLFTQSAICEQLQVAYARLLMY